MARYEPSKQFISVRSLGSLCLVTSINCTWKHETCDVLKMGKLHAYGELINGQYYDELEVRSKSHLILRVLV